MRRTLDAPIPDGALPEGVTLVPFDESVARQCRALMNAVYGASEHETTASFDDWYPALIADSEYEPGLCLVAMSGGDVVGFCQGWTSPFIKDIVVAPTWRGRGLGSALITHILQLYRDRGGTKVDLKTSVYNDKAQSVYRRLGFEIVERID